MARSTLQIAKRLYDLGFAVHWLRPKSKAPIKSGWARGKRTPWEELKASYSPQNNLGVELGKATRFPDGTFLCVIDCDVKSENADDRADMEKALKGLIGEDLDTLTVWTGRGNGSRHIYVRCKEPLPSRRYTEAGHKVEVLMPSVPPSKADMESIPRKKIEKGVRSRVAWEISLMGNGRQCVLPPSLHPDTGREYKSKGKLDTYEDIKRWKLPSGVQLDEEKQERKSSQDYRFTDVDLVGSKLPDTIVDAIISGKGVTDRSASLFEAALAMFRAQFKREDVISALTDEGNYLSSCTYDHAKTNSRVVAARWLEKYTISKAEQEASAIAQFDDEVEDNPLLADSEAVAKQSDTIAYEPGPGDWRDEIERGSLEQGARPKPTLKNLVLILRGETSPTVIKYNEFSGIDSYNEDTPWGGKKGRELRDQDLIDIKFWLSEEYRFEPHVTLIMEAVKKIGAINAFHPVRDYLRTLEWDGRPRLNNWLFDYMGAKGPRKYVQAIGAKTLIAMVKRVLEPGCKFDQVLILEGAQGVGKSTAVRLLSEPWFSDGAIDIQDKDGVLSMRSVWVVELGELSGMRKADVDQLKEFISRQSDRIRAPYGRMSENFPRQCIFIGTTNSSEYLKDTTGNRRFWPVRVQQCDFKALARDRDQLIAEALCAYRFGEPIYLDEEEVLNLAVRQQEKRVFQDGWADVLEQFFMKEVDMPGGREFNYDEFTISEILEFPLKAKDSRQEQMRAADALRLLGFSRFRRRGESGRTYYWRKKT
jgi:predicted P-loop ATPase